MKVEGDKKSFDFDNKKITVNKDLPDNQIIVNRDGRVPGGGDRGYGSWNRPQFYRPTNFWSGGWSDPYGCRWTNGLLIANIVVNSIAIAGYWSGGCCGCGYFNYYGGNGYGPGVCGYCTFWNGYQCVGMNQYPGWNGGECIQQTCSTCMYVFFFSSPRFFFFCLQVFFFFSTSYRLFFLPLSSSHRLSSFLSLSLSLSLSLPCLYSLPQVLRPVVR